jgi:DNA primase|tara:strand:+ start:112 stop:1047 length:936 start_codon:yes stop_codon:yes gene_type:complete
MFEDKKRIVTQILGSYYQSGNEYLYHCPYCDHHKKKFSINFTKNVAKCWRCDKSHNNIYRVVRKFGTYQQKEKYRELQGLVNLSDFDELFKEYNNIEEKMIPDMPKEFISLCNKDLPRGSSYAFRYLSSRGIGRRDILKWKIGYCKEGRYGGRIIIPSFDVEGDLNYFIARSYVGHSLKYLNPRIDRDIIFNELNIDWDEPIIIVEGAFDAIASNENTIPILGSTLREKSRLFQAIAMHDTPVFMALDQDAESKSDWIIKSLLKYDVEVSMVPIDDKDVSSMGNKEFNARLLDANKIEGDMYFFQKELENI